MQVCIKNNKIMEREKYYTPAIEEFCVGFEFEALNSRDWFFSESYFGWKNITLSEYLLMRDFTIQNLISAIGKGWLRIKYLDREDIESFGFESIITKSIGKDHYTMDGKKSTRGNLLLEHDWLNNKITIKTPNYIRDGSGNFDGYIIYVNRLIIKNKSEFSRLLKQLSII